MDFLDYLSLIIVVFFIGYAIINRLENILKEFSKANKNMNSIVDSMGVKHENPIYNKENVITQKIVIDDSKYVTSVHTDQIEKKYQTLGEQKTFNENISLSVNKLKSMKK